MIQEAVELNIAGEKHFLADDVESAAQCFENAIELWPEFVSARSNLGVAYWSQGRRFDAVRNLEIAFSIEPSDMNVFLNLYSVLQGVGRNELAENIKKRWSESIDEEERLSREFTFSCTTGSFEEWIQSASQIMTMRTPHFKWKYAETNRQQALNLKAMHYSNFDVGADDFFDKIVGAKQLYLELATSPSQLKPERSNHLDEIVALSQESKEDARLAFSKFFFEEFFGESFEWGSDTVKQE